jgi:pSer/pThr/pTyr-binding forkhead associated (FHA) protein
MKMLLQNVSSIARLPDIVVEEFPFVIGRREGSQAQLALAFISRQHCKFVLADRQIQVQDLESQNGTFVNGKKAIKPLAVRDGDEVSLGSICFRAIIPEINEETAETRSLLTDRDFV